MGSVKARGGRDRATWTSHPGSPCLAWRPDAVTARRASRSDGRAGIVCRAFGVSARALLRRADDNAVTGENVSRARTVETRLLAGKGGTGTWGTVRAREARAGGLG